MFFQKREVLNWKDLRMYTEGNRDTASWIALVEVLSEYNEKK